MGEKLLKLISKTFDIPLERVSPESSLVYDLYLDPNQVVQLIWEIENHFDVVIPDEDALSFVVVQDIINWLEGKTK
jgi:acyl carrier protein